MTNASFICSAILLSFALETASTTSLGPRELKLPRLQSLRQATSWINTWPAQYLNYFTLRYLNILLEVPSSFPLSIHGLQMPELEGWALLPL
jgi:hypothetical protein